MEPTTEKKVTVYSELKHLNDCTQAITMRAVNALRFGIYRDGHCNVELIADEMKKEFGRVLINKLNDMVALIHNEVEIHSSVIGK